MATLLFNAFDRTNWPTTIAIAVITFILIKTWIKTRNYPPGPFPLPFIGNLLSFILKRSGHPLSILDNFRQKYGDIFTLWMGNEAVVVVSNWDLVKEALITRSKECIGRKSRILYDMHGDGHDTILFTSYGAKWQLMKKILIGAVRKYAVSEKCRDLVCNTTDHIFLEVTREKQPIDPAKYIYQLINNVMTEALYGERHEQNSEEFKKNQKGVEELIKAFGEVFPSDILPILRPIYWKKEVKLRNMVKNVHTFLCQKYKEHLEAFEKDRIKDFTDAIISAREDAELEEKVACGQLTDGDLSSIIADLFLAGIHTTYIGLLWLILVIANNENVQEKIVEEIYQVIGNRTPTQEDKSRCHYLSAVINESLRYRTQVPLGVDHTANVDTEIGGFPIKKGTTVVFYLHALNTDSQYWPEPEKFKPERFLQVNGTIDTVRKNSFVPFGIGRRSCPGEKLAIIEIFLVIVRILQQCKISLPKGQQSANLDPKEMLMLTEPEHFKLCFEPRV